MEADDEEQSLIQSNGSRITEKLRLTQNPSFADISRAQEKYGWLPPPTFPQKVQKYIKSRCACSYSCFVSSLFSFIPVLSWLPKYQASYIMPDIISGLTVGVLRIPQGMAFAILASLKAQNGLYISFFPVIVYFLLGTSRHVSVGSFGLVAIMASSSIAKVGNHSPGASHNVSINGTVFNSSSNGTVPTPIEVATSLAIAVGFWQVLMGLLHLGALTVLLSAELISGFMAGVAVHIITSQIGNLFGIPVKQFHGPLKLVYTYEEIFSNLHMTNYATLIVAATSIFILAVTKEQVNERFREKLKLPVPIDLIVVILSTSLSYALDLSKHYNVEIIGHIPEGFPVPSAPRMDLLSQLVIDSLVIAVVILAISLTLAELFAKMHHYEISSNQELFALGIGNIFSSFFACYPSSVALTRSLLQERTGGKTQVASLVSAMLLLLVLFALAPLLYSLPECVLSAMLIVALKPMFLKGRDFIKAWRISKIDAAIWLVTILSTIILDITYGLIVGVCFALTTVLARSLFPPAKMLGNIPGTELYLDIKRYSEAKEVRGIKIFQFGSALYFMNTEYFKDFIYKHVPINISEDTESPSEAIHYIIIDCSCFSYIDMAGLETLSEVIKEYKTVGITVFLSGCPIYMCDTMAKVKFFDELLKEPYVFMTTDDAVLFCFKCQSCDL